MDFKKIFLFLLVIIISLVLLFLISLRLTRKPNIPGVEFFPTPTPVPITTKKITISGIKMNNFLSSPIKTNDHGDALFVKTKGYQLVYLRQYNKFLITILSSPFEENRKKGEENFLKKLGITKEEACKLNASISTPYFVNPQYSGIKYPLSFCENQ